MLRSRFESPRWLVFLITASSASGYCSRASAQAASAAQAAQPTSRTQPIAQPAQASQPAPPSVSETERLNEEGARLFQAGDYRRASERFIEAYAISREPNLMFNIARCYDELGERGLAIEKYEAFLASPNIDPAGAGRARAAIERLRTSTPTPAGRPTPNPQSPVTEARDSSGSSSPGSSSPGSSTGAGTSGSTAPTPTGRREGISPVFPWLSLGLGMVGAGFGAAFYTMGASDHDKVTRAEGFADPRGVSTMTEREAHDLSESGKSKKTLGVIGLGVGGTLMAVSIGLFLSTGSSKPAVVGSSAARAPRAALGYPGQRLEHTGSNLLHPSRRRSLDQGPLTVAVAPGPGGAAVLLQGAF